MSLRARDGMPSSEAQAGFSKLGAEHAQWVLAQAAIEGLEDLAAGRMLDEAELDEALAGTLSRQPRQP